MPNSLQLRLGNRISTESLKSVCNVDEVYVGLGRHGDQIRLAGMPLDRVERIKIIGRKDTQHDLASLASSQTRSNGSNSDDLLNIIPDYFWELPDNETTIRCYTS